VESARVVADIDSSPYKLVVRTNGTSIGSFHSGWFRLADNRDAWVFMEETEKTLVVQAAGKLYLIGPRSFDLFLQEVERFITVEQ
jgi:hypothetical protein